MHFKTLANAWCDAIPRPSYFIVYDVTGFGIRRKHPQPTDYTLEAYVLEMLVDAQRMGAHYAVFVHGRPKPQPGEFNVRTGLRATMRDPITTPELVRRRCSQHEDAFVAALRGYDFSDFDFEELVLQRTDADVMVEFYQEEIAVEPVF